MTTIFILCFTAAIASAAHIDLQDKYTFKKILYSDDDGEFYELHWNFTKTEEFIYFAVNVSTIGWVGFGLSPNGMMPNSDVVIGWVDGEQTFFHDRYAEGRFLPPIDTSQDWFLVNSEEEDGFTILEFSRNFTTCDTRDLDITASTSHVVWSYSTTDPTDPTGAGAAQHKFYGARSINLISGLPERIHSPEDEDFFEITVSNVTIPEAYTTYWCETFRLPSVLTNTTRYINRIDPVITPHARSFVHHMLVGTCPFPLLDEEEFVYPEGVGSPVGGIGQNHFVILEIHYDNPENTRDIVDSSGMRYFYTTKEPDLKAGMLTLGHRVTHEMIIPPRTSNYTIAGICDTGLIKSSIPPEGITIFANFLHTHLVGRGLVLEHYRYNSECNVIEELEPIDQNPKYDFNFQQYTHLPKGHLVLPGDILILKCFYDTTAISQVTQGGESTTEEMCLTFPLYYPRPKDGSILSICASSPNPEGSYTDFYNYLNSLDQDLAMKFFNPETIKEGLMNLDWEHNPQYARELQYSVLNSTVVGISITENKTIVRKGIKLPESECPYEAPSKCSDVKPKTCCEKILSGAPPPVHLSVLVAFMMVSLSLLMTL